MSSRRTMLTKAAWRLLALSAAALSWQACFEPRERVELQLIDQDLNETESAVADRAIKILLGIDSIQLVICQRAGRYEVHSARGKTFFKRVATDEGYSYEVVRTEGLDPLARQDAAALPDLKSELAAGSNPLKTDLTAQDSGYSGPGDPRISFLEESKVSYPLAYERIAALFDGEHVGDLVVEFKPWGWYPVGSHDVLENVGAHGHLNVVASRAPLIFAGKGAKKKLIIDQKARSVDIAPTVARALGIAKTYGVDERGNLGHDVFLKWQDGHPLEQVLDGETPERVVILVNDALTHSELLYQLGTPAKLATYRWLLSQGSYLKHGAVVNFPSNTFASHNTIATGAYSGHHGLIDNWFYERTTGKRRDPLADIFNTGKLLTDDVETLYEAIHRSFEVWDPDRFPLGNFAVSINTPATRGADLALLEGMQPVDWGQCPEPQGLAFPALDTSISQRSQAADNLAVSTFVKAFLGQRTSGGVKTRCAHPPRLTMINLALTDDASHENGPHADGLRRALVQTDQRQQLLFDALKQAGAFDSTLFVFTSDHGQCLQDARRGKDFRTSLTQAGIRFVSTHAFIYLLTMRVSIDGASFQRGQPRTVTVRAVDDDTAAPVVGATVTLRSGAASVSVKTGKGGEASLTITPVASETTLTVSDGVHNDYSRTFR